MLALDDSGDRKDGRATAHVGHQRLCRYDKTDNGVVTVTTPWTDGRIYYPAHAEPYTPAKHFAKGKSDPGFHTKLRIGTQLARRAEAAGFAFRAVAANSANGDQDALRGELAQASLPFVMALTPPRGTWAYGPDAHTPVDSARAPAWNGPQNPGDWRAVTRTIHDGHTETWYPADATLGRWGPDGTTRLVVATKDPATLPEKSTWYLATNLPRPGGPREQDSEYPAADLEEVVRIYGLRHWIEQAYKQVKNQLGWADFQVRSNTAIRTHQTLVNCAFNFCWTTDPPPPNQQQDSGTPETSPDSGNGGTCENRTPAHTLPAPGATASTRLADPLNPTATLMANLVPNTATTTATSPDGNRQSRRRPTPLPPDLTNYRWAVSDQWHDEAIRRSLDDPAPIPARPTVNGHEVTLLCGQRMARLADSGSLGLCPPMSRWAAVEFPRGPSGQRDHPLAGQGLGEAVRIAGSQDEMRVVQ